MCLHVFLFNVSECMCVTHLELPYIFLCCNMSCSCRADQYKCFFVNEDESTVFVKRVCVLSWGVTHFSWPLRLTTVVDIGRFKLPTKTNLQTHTQAQHTYVCTHQFSKCFLFYTFFHNIVHMYGMMAEHSLAFWDCISFLEVKNMAHSGHCAEVRFRFWRFILIFLQHHTGKLSV